MPNYRDVSWLLGRRFVCDFRVMAIGATPDGGTEDDRVVEIVHLGERSEISYGELVELIRTGFVAEAADGRM